jgi:hypothetical protein
MMVRDRMVYGGIRTSKRMARLSWFQRDLFHGLLLVADDYGRFEADAETLRTVLFGPLLAKVSVRDVQAGLLRCAAADVGLVKLYTVRGRGYGKVVNFRQKLAKRRALYPDEDDGPPPEPELFTPAAECGATDRKERKKEGSAGAAPAPETQEEWIERLRAAWPHVDIAAELRAAEANRRLQKKRLERDWFEHHWLSKCSAPVEFASRAPDDAPAECPGWREYLAVEYAEEDWARSARACAWAALPRHWQERIIREMSRRELAAL